MGDATRQDFAPGAEALAQLQGTIESPQPGAQIETTEIARGTVTGEVPPDCSIQLAVNIGGMFWLKDPSVSSDEGPWQHPINEGSRLPFTLELLAADEAATKAFKEWFKEGARTGSYPGLISTRGTRRLASVANLRIRQ